MSTETRHNLISSLAEPHKVTILFVETKECGICRSWCKSIERMIAKMHSDLVILRHVDGNDNIVQDALGFTEPPVVIIADNGEEIREFIGRGSAADLAEIESIIRPLID